MPDTSGLPSLVTIAVALSGWAKVLYDYWSGMPRISGQIFQVMTGIGELPPGSGRKYASFLTYVYLTNASRNALHMLDYELEVFWRGDWRPLSRFYGFHNVTEFTFNMADGTEAVIRDLPNNLIYQKNAPVEFSKPLHGWILFVGDERLYRGLFSEYRLTCIDAFKRRHVISTRREDLAAVAQLSDLAGITFLPKGAKPTIRTAKQAIEDQATTPVRESPSPS